jgi:hypothetical protein
MLDKLIKKKAEEVKTKEEKKFGLGSILKKKGNVESIEENTGEGREKKEFGFKKEFNFGFKLKGKGSEETKQPLPTRRSSLVTRHSLYEKPRQVIVKLFGEDLADSIMDEIIKSGKDRYAYLTIEKGIKEDVLVKVYSEVYGNDYVLKLEGEDFFVDKDGYLVDRKTGFKYHYLPIDNDVVLVPRSIYFQKLNVSKVEENIAGEGDLWKIFVDVVKRAMGGKVNDIIVEGQGSVYKIFYKQLGGGKLPVMTPYEFLE